MQVQTFNSPEEMFEAMFGPAQQDDHMQKWRWFQYAFGGSIARWNEYLADRAKRRGQ